MNIFVCTKPLQVMIAMILSRKYSPATLHVTSGFKGSSEVCVQREALAPFFEHARYFATRNQAVSAALRHSPERLFLDSDFRYSTQLLLALGRVLRQKTEIHIYEEGVGTYRNDIIKPRTRRAHALLGMARYLGDSWAACKIHVFDPEKHAQALPDLVVKREAIRPSLVDWLRQREAEVIALLAPDLRLPELSGAEAHLYLTNAVKLDGAVLDFLRGKPAGFVKPHPDESAANMEALASPTIGLHVLSCTIPAEIVILQLSRRFERLFVIHHGSSAFHYMRSLPSVDELLWPVEASA